MSADPEQLQRLLDERTREVEELQAELREFTETSKDYERELTEHIRALEQEVTRYQKERNALHQERDLLKSQIRSHKEESARMVRTLENEVELLKEKQDGLMAIKRTYEQENDQLGRKERETKATVERLQAGLGKEKERALFLEQELDDRRRQVQEAEQHIQRLRDSLRDLEHNFSVQLDRAATDRRSQCAVQLLQLVSEEQSWRLDHLVEEADQRAALFHELFSIRQMAPLVLAPSPSPPPYCSASPSPSPAPEVPVITDPSPRPQPTHSPVEEPEPAAEQTDSPSAPHQPHTHSERVTTGRPRASATVRSSTSRLRVSDEHKPHRASLGNARRPTVPAVARRQPPSVQKQHASTQTEGSATKKPPVPRLRGVLPPATLATGQFRSVSLTSADKITRPMPVALAGAPAVPGAPAAGEPGLQTVQAMLHLTEDISTRLSACQRRCYALLR